MNFQNALQSSTKQQMNALLQPAFTPWPAAPPRHALITTRLYIVLPPAGFHCYSLLRAAVSLSCAVAAKSNHRQFLCDISCAFFFLRLTAAALPPHAAASACTFTHPLQSWPRCIAL
jgi:hypothetical protein